ncbi:MAG: ketoacyl-ACP synthase III [Lachnospiraceae bacterium]|jgi:3-oxoacyl-[acyl-carrier-protein] synthase-3|nr:ketoacyl-ACP synthase III [Lachnospiraceae bacterium]
MAMYGKIEHACHYAPENIVDNYDLSKIMDTSDGWIRTRTGIVKRHISTSENTSDLATKVARKLLLETNTSSDEIDFIIVATMTPDFMSPSTACLVGGNIGAGKAFAFDINGACAGFIFALAVGEKLIRSGYKAGLVIGSEVLSKTLNWEDRSTAVLFGDGAGGVLLKASDTPHIICEKLQSDGTRGSSIVALEEKVKNPFANNKEENNHFLTMNGKEVFDFATRDVPKNMIEVLDLAGVGIDQIDYILLHQANLRIIDRISRKIKADREKFLINIDEYGNTSAATIPILLSENIANKTLKIGDGSKLLLTGFGGGLNWGSIYLIL